MARNRKKSESNGTHAGTISPSENEAPESPNAPTEPEQVRRPAMSWALSSDRSTRLEVAAWLNTFKNQQGEEYEQVSFTFTRSYRDNDNVWWKGGSLRSHDIPCLLFLLQKAHNWALDRRTSDSSVPF